MNIELIHGDCLLELKRISDNSVDSIVTDPPYGLSFMGKKWDYDVPSIEIWQECLRVLKPGGYLLAFAGTRTQHRMAVRIENAGFEIRDMIAWVYGSGFPKSLNIGKVLDKFLKTGNASWNGTGDSSNGALGYAKLQHKQGYRPNDYSNAHQNKSEITEDLGKEWEGWGTALKPSLESITLAQKTPDFCSLLDILIKENLYILKKELFQFPALVSIAEKSLMGNQQGGEDDSRSIAQWIAEKHININEDLPVVIDMLQYQLTENTNLNIVLGWLGILVELYNHMNTYTTETKTSLTIDLKTLSLLEFESIYQNIIQAKDKQINLLNANVYNAELLFKGLQLKLKTIQEHFAQECAISRVAENSLEGAGLTPNLSPIIMSRKPLSEKTVAENCLKWGTGGINIDESRVLGDKGNGNWKEQQKDSTSIFGNGGKEYQGEQSNLGRFPANLIHDGSEEVVSLFPNDSQRFFYCAKASKSERNRGCDGLIDKKAPKLKSISNFCIKCGKREDYKCNCNVGFEYKEQPNYQNITKNNHPTVKPVSLMQYLVRLVTRKGGVVLDPFTGSGTTGIACKLEGMSFIGIEREQGYIDIARSRIDAWGCDGNSVQESLFSDQ